jgi:hypothetical protein
VNAGLPRRPSDVPNDVPLAKLIEQYQEHVRAVFLARPGMADPATAEAMFENAIAALAVAHAVVDRLLAARWSTVRDALAADAGRGREVTAACGLDPDEVAAGLSNWADQQNREGLMSDAEYHVVVLLARGVRWDL